MGICAILFLFNTIYIILITIIRVASGQRKSRKTHQYFLKENISNNITILMKAIVTLTKFWYASTFLTVFCHWPLATLLNFQFIFFLLILNLIITNWKKYWKWICTFMQIVFLICFNYRYFIIIFNNNF